MYSIKTAVAATADPIRRPVLKLLLIMPKIPPVANPPTIVLYKSSVDRREAVAFLPAANVPAVNAPMTDVLPMTLNCLYNDGNCTANYFIIFINYKLHKSYLLVIAGVFHTDWTLPDKTPIPNPAYLSLNYTTLFNYLFILCRTAVYWVVSVVIVII